MGIQEEEVVFLLSSCFVLLLAGLKEQRSLLCGRMKGDG